MKTSILITIAVLGFTAPMYLIAQERSVPDSKYHVHKVYDEKGNLIEYDSSSVTTSNNEYYESAVDNWSFTPDEIDSSYSFNPCIPHFKNPFPEGDFFRDQPGFPDFHYIDSLMQNFSFSFSLPDQDSAFYYGHPFFHFDENFQGMQFNFETYLEELDEMMEKLFPVDEDISRKFTEPDQPFGEPEAPSPESVIPAPEPQKYFGPVQDI
jgi:hypothetical protein